MAGEVTTAESHGGQVVTIELARPEKLNALTLEMLAALEERLREIAASTTRVVVLRTAGPRAFSVGADIDAFSRLSAPEMWRRWIADGHRVLDRLATLPQPTIAVLQGLAVGGGLELALATDLRIAAPTARLGLPETGIGTIPGWGGTARLPRLVGPSRAKQLILTRRLIDADTALHWGLLNAVNADLDGELEGWLADLLGAAPIAQQVAKQIVDAGAGGAGSAVLEALASGFTSYSDDFGIGVRAFQARSNPRFHGR